MLPSTFSFSLKGENFRIVYIRSTRIMLGSIGLGGSGEMA